MSTLTAEAAPAAEMTFEELYRSCRDDVYAYVATLLRDRSAAEDVTASAFERAYKRRGTFDPARGEARAWIFGIARNAALDELRRRKRRAWLSHDPPDESAAASHSVVEESERRIALRAAMESLPGPDRELIALRYFSGLSLAEIAATLGISESNAGTRTHRALVKLRKAFDESA